MVEFTHPLPSEFSYHPGVLVYAEDSERQPSWPRSTALLRLALPARVCLPSMHLKCLALVGAQQMFILFSTFI